MKIIKTIKTKEDLKGESLWCYATRENYEALKTLGITGFYYETFDGYKMGDDYKSTDVFCFSTSSNVCWCSYENREGDEITFDDSITNQKLSNVESFGFQEPQTFSAQILKVYNSKEITEYIGCINNNTPAKWSFDGTCIFPGNTYSLFKEYKQRIYTKENSPRFSPKQKYKFSWTEKMSLQLEQSGWRRVTNEEIESFKDI